MTMVFAEGFGDYPAGRLPASEALMRKASEPVSTTFTQPIARPWWQRLLRLRPAGTAYLHFTVRFDRTGWHDCEVVAHYPAGLDEIKVRFETWGDGSQVYVKRPPLVGTYDREG